MTDAFWWPDHDPTETGSCSASGSVSGSAKSGSCSPGSRLAFRPASRAPWSSSPRSGPPVGQRPEIEVAGRDGVAGPVVVPVERIPLGHVPAFLRAAPAAPAHGRLAAPAPSCPPRSRRLWARVQ